MSLTVAELAHRLDIDFDGNGDLIIERVATLSNAGPGTLSFLSNPSYRDQLADTRASAVIIHPEQVLSQDTTWLLSENPYLSYARAATLLYPAWRPEPGVHPAASVHPDARLGDNVFVDAGAVVGEDSAIGDGCIIGARAVVDRGVTLGSDVLLHPGATVLHHVIVGDRVIIHSGAVIGADGFGFANDAGRWEKIPQVGRVVIGDDVEIGACTTIDRGAIDDTVIGNGVKLDNQIQIGHNVTVGDHTAMAACVGISGSVTIGKHCMLAGAVGVAGHVDIADGTTVTGKSMVTHSLSSGVYSSGLSVQEAGEWRKNAVRLRHLNKLFTRVKRLEKFYDGK